MGSKREARRAGHQPKINPMTTLVTTATTTAGVDNDIFHPRAAPSPAMANRPSAIPLNRL